MVKAMYKGKEISCTEITAENILKCKSDGKVGHFGNISIGNYMYWTSSGFDGFYLILAPSELYFIENKK